jgi:glycosyltransferase involved in cell wall biosynthesis
MRASTPTQSQQDMSHQQHICFVTDTYPPEVNGVALTLSHLVQGLLGRGHLVSIVHPHIHTSEGIDRRLEPLVTAVRGFPLPGYKALRFGLPAGRLLRNVWRQQRPDAIYVATEGPLGWSAVRVARHFEIPVVSGFHTNFHSYAKHYGVGWLQHAICRYLCAFHNRTRATLVPSTEMRDWLTTLGVHRVSVLSRGVDSRLFNPGRRSAELRRQWGVSEDGLAVLYVGRVAPEKNIELAIKAYRAMQALHRNAPFVIVGEGPLYTPLQQAHPDLIFCGFRTDEPLAVHYASADVFLFPSETETFGNVTLEAMASGLAIAAYDYAAAHMHLTHGKTGLLVPYGDAQAFVETAAKLASEPWLLRKLRRQARAEATRIDWTCVVEQFETLLIQAMHQGEAVSHALIPRRDATTSAHDAPSPI